MLNTLNAILIILSVVVIFYVNHERKRRKSKKSFFGTASALINQSLPTEIFHQILLLTNVKTLGRCSSVSKIWNTLSNDNHVKNTIWDAIIDKHEREYKSMLANSRRESTLFYKPRLPYLADYRKEWIVSDILLARKHSKFIVDVADPKIIFNGRLPNEVYNQFMKIRARCVRVDSEEFVLQNEYQVFIPKRRNNNDIAKNFIRGKEIELITDLSSGFVVHGTHLQVPTIHRSRSIEPISFKDKFMPAGMDWNLLFILLLLPSTIADYRQYVRPNRAPWYQLLIELSISSMFIMWISTRQILHSLTAPSTLAYLAALSSAIIAKFYNMELLGHLANNLILEICGCGLILLALAIILALLSNNWSDTRNAIRDNQIRKSLLDQTLQSLVFAWYNLMAVVMSNFGNKEQAFQELLVFCSCAAACIPILAIFAPYSYSVF